MNVVMENCSQDMQRWLSLRKGKIGSSNIPTIVGENRFESPLQLWQKFTQELEERADNDDLWMGRMMEPIIGEVFQRKTGIVVKRADCLVAHKTEPRFQASPDFWELLLNEDKPESGILETKHTKERNRKRWLDGSPLSHLMQLNWQLGCCDLKQGHITGLIGGDASNPVIEPFEYDQSLFDTCAEKALQFLECVEKNIPPIAGPSDGKVLHAMLGARKNEMVVLPRSALRDLIAWQKLSEELDEAKEVSDAVERKLKGCKARILQMMGKATAAVCEDFTVTAKEQDHGGQVMPRGKHIRMTIRSK